VSDERPTEQTGNKRKAAAKYVVLQLPGKVLLLLVLLLLQRWLGWSWSAIGVIVGIWVAIDALLFPFVWRAYDPTAKGDQHSMIGLRGEVKKRLAPEGTVLVRGELWRAEAAAGATIEPGESVEVVAREGLTLRVEPTRS